MPLINYLTKVHFTDGVLEAALRSEIGALGVKRPFVVTNAGIIECGLLERLLGALPEKILPTIYGNVPGIPSESPCLKAAALYKSNKCDCIIGLGGGSVLDLAKTVGLAVTHDGPLINYTVIEGGVARIKNILPPIIAVPTTAGTGSEVSRGANIVFAGRGTIGLISPFLSPKVAICDPTVTLTLSPRATAGNGMDAMTHCIETYLVTAYDPTADGIALDGLARVTANIERAVSVGQDIDARREMMAAALNGALALQKGLGSVHAMSHALAGLTRHELHHGTLNAVLLPHVLEFNAPAVSHRFAALKSAMGLTPEADISSELRKLNERLGLPSDLASMGIDRGTVSAAAPLAENDHTNGTNPRRAGTHDYLEMMRAAL